MKKQKEIFQISEGNRWFQRNKESHHLCDSDWMDDDIVHFMRHHDISPKKVLEIGCSNGKRLHILQKIFASEGVGIDPSFEAIEDGKQRFPNISLSLGTADTLAFKNNSFDTIILGFFLLMCDRDDLFKIAMEVDRCLKDGGMLIIQDFYASFSYKNSYAHLEGMYSYKMDYASMFTWNPAYTEIAKELSSHSVLNFKEHPDERIVITALYKNTEKAYLVNPFVGVDNEQC